MAIEVEISPEVVDDQLGEYDEDTFNAAMDRLQSAVMGVLLAGGGTAHVAEAIQNGMDDAGVKG